MFSYACLLAGLQIKDDDLRKLLQTSLRPKKKTGKKKSGKKQEDGKEAEAMES